MNLSKTLKIIGSKGSKASSPGGGTSAPEKKQIQIYEKCPIKATIFLHSMGKIYHFTLEIGLFKACFVFLTHFAREKKLAHDFKNQFL